MVEDLLRGFVAEDWVEELDFGTLEKVSGSYVSYDLRDREDDIIWRVRHRDGWLYVYLLLEFQSQVDPWMALRILVYTGLLYQDLIKVGEVRSGQKLPAVFPLVLYNGRPRWSAARDVGELIELLPASLKRYHPAQRYFLLEQRAVEERVGWAEERSPTGTARRRRRNAALGCWASQAQPNLRTGAGSTLASTSTSAPSSPRTAACSAAG